jgi:NDP-sugar pyrophosphorylase family protein
MAIISMNLCVLRETIKNYFKNGARFGASISYLEELKEKK